MKQKAAFFLILIICAAAVFSQEAVGKMTVKRPDIEIDIDFYDNKLEISKLVEIITSRILSAELDSLKSVDDEIFDELIDEIEKRVLAIDTSEFEVSGYATEYFAIKSNLNYKEKDYFVISFVPDDSYWIFEEIK